MCALARMTVKVQAFPRGQRHLWNPSITKRCNTRIRALSIFSSSLTDIAAVDAWSRQVNSNY